MLMILFRFRFSEVAIVVTDGEEFWIILIIVQCQVEKFFVDLVFFDDPLFGLP